MDANSDQWPAGAGCGVWSAGALHFRLQLLAQDVSRSWKARLLGDSR